MYGQVAEHDSLCFINATLVLFMVAKHADGSVDKFLAELVRSRRASAVRCAFGTFRILKTDVCVFGFRSC